MRQLFYLFMVCGLMTAFTACSPENNDPVDSGTNGIDPPTALVLRSMRVIDSDGQEFQIKFICEGNKLIRIEFPEKRINYFYDGDLLSREEETVGGNTATTEYEYDANSRLIRAYRLNSGNWYVESTIDYNGSVATVQEITGNSDGTTSARLITVTFSSGNIVAYSVQGDDYSAEYEITYDSKNSIFKEIKGLEKLAVVQHSLQYCMMGANNAKRLRGVNGTNLQYVYSYQYNSEGYPTNITIDITSHDGTRSLVELFLEYY